MKRKFITFRALGILFCILSVALVFNSCKSQLAERDFVLSQKRDSRLTGSWKSIREEPTDNYLLVFEYTSKGERKQYHNGELGPLKEYFYTKDNILYVLELGAGLKRSNWTREYDYHFSEDENTLFIKHREGTTVEQWQRIAVQKEK